MARFPELWLLLRGFGCLISYEPLRTEVNVADILPELGTIRGYCIPPRAAIDPAEEARNALIAADGATTALLIPGRKFDALGTRHGQGGGWYDRFLEQVPREWLRVGFCFEDQFSDTPLPREAWDQPMDYVVVLDRDMERIRLYSSEGTIDHD